MLMILHEASSFCFIVWLILASPSLRAACARRDGVPGAPHIAALRQETEELFYHGFENYMRHAFPEDELRPLTCKPLTRDRANPAHVEINDVLGNYSLTLVDSLSTLAILASSPSGRPRNKPLGLFQDAVKDLIELYGDGSPGPSGQGRRARGFDLDSKVQVFETAIRGLGGLLSAHLFAVGDLPISGYSPPKKEADGAKSWNPSAMPASCGGIKWRNGLVYDGQLLRLAYDLGNRLLPAFWTSTGIPYPRVNLKYGTPFYANSPGRFTPDGQCGADKQIASEITETCSAGAGSLVLEFTVLSRLTSDPKFEELAKRAFWAIWNRRSPIDLIGAGIDAETGTWQHSWTGIGAGIDSFFEYAFKSHVLLSGSEAPVSNSSVDALDPRSLLEPLSVAEHSSAAFLDVWDAAHAAIKRHIYRGANFQHPHHIQVDLSTGAARAFWVDALSAYFPGLLAMSGHVEEAIETHLMSTALWARFSALPERYNMAAGTIEGGLGWWVGRPELIESTWYLYRATEDPFYIYVGEMILRDIKRRCWTKCGWSGLQNVVTGEKIDRMESFFLGETAKYLFLTFDPDHPLNKLDAPFVFSTEGHPLIIPPYRRLQAGPADGSRVSNEQTCPAPPSRRPFTISNVAARGDVYHAASLARLHLMPKRGQVETALLDYAQDHPSITLADVQSPSNWTYYPWTLPPELIPGDAMSTAMPTAPTFELSFPAMQKQGTTQAPLQRVNDGIVINMIGGLRLSLVQDVPIFVNDDYTSAYRVQGINNIALGKDEKVYMTSSSYEMLNPSDPLFTRVRDTSMLDLVVDVGQAPPPPVTSAVNASVGRNIEIEMADIDGSDGAMKAAWNSILAQISGLVKDAQELVIAGGGVNGVVEDGGRLFVPAITPTGIGAAPLPDWREAPTIRSDHAKDDGLPWTQVFAAGDLCDEKLPMAAVKNHQIILLRRGNCSFSKKLANLPTIHPTRHAFRLAIVVDYDSIDPRIAMSTVFGVGSTATDFVTRPLLDEPQMTSGGLPRQHLVPMVMVGGGAQTYEALKNAKRIGIKRRYRITTQGIPVANVMIV